MKTQNKLTTGTVIHGTHRTQDLIPAFLDVVAEVAPDHYSGMMAAAFGPIPSYVLDDGDSSDWWDSDDAVYLLESLFDILNDHAPDGCYFGAHAGDGSDFGFWACEEWSASNLEGARYIGMLEIENGGVFEVMATETKLIFGSACNAGFLESGYILRDDCESLDEALQELQSDLETFYRDGARYVSRIVSNERM